MRVHYFAALLSLLAMFAQADEATVEVSELCDGSLTGNAYNLAAINDIIGGQWNQLGRAHRYTLDNPVNPFTITYDAPRSQLLIESPDGPRLRLRPFAQAKLADVPLTVNNLRQQQTSYISEDGSKTVRLSGLDMEVLMGCPLETAASFYWTYSQGGRQAYGVLIFLSDDYGFGVNGNDTGAQRTTVMYR